MGSSGRSGFVRWSQYWGLVAFGRPKIPLSQMSSFDVFESGFGSLIDASAPAMQTTSWLMSSLGSQIEVWVFRDALFAPECCSPLPLSLSLSSSPSTLFRCPQIERLFEFSIRSEILQSALVSPEFVSLTKYAFSLLAARTRAGRDERAL
jgi:hypothetical protein